jgi:hypothetical protein
MPPTQLALDVSRGQQDGGSSSSAGSAAKELPPKGPSGMVFVPLPVPIASTLPPPNAIEPLAHLSAPDREALITGASERRRELTESGQLLNRVVYDSMVRARFGRARARGRAAVRVALREREPEARSPCQRQ